MQNPLRLESLTVNEVNIPCNNNKVSNALTSILISSKPHHIHKRSSGTTTVRVRNHGATTTTISSAQTKSNKKKIELEKGTEGETTIRITN